MKLELQKNMKALLKFFKGRIRDYPIYENLGPGSDEDLITQITLGYQFDQAGWIAIVFDTRSTATIDGKWQNYIEENELPFEHWMDAYEKIYVDEGSVDVVFPDGSKASLNANSDLAEVIGECLRDLFISCREDGLLNKLPCSDVCQLVIEEHEGQFGWSEGIDGSQAVKPIKEGPEFLLEATDELLQKVSKLSKKKQIVFWIDRLNQIASVTKPIPESIFEATSYYDTSSNVDALAELGDTAVIPMLELVLKLAGKSQYRGDKDPKTKKGKVQELYRSSVMLGLIWKVDEIEYATPEVESLLRKIVTKAVKTNAKRTLWGTVPVFAARAISNLFSGYDWPDLGDQNELMDPIPFVGVKKK